MTADVVRSLVSTAWLAEHAADPGVRVLEVDGEAARYYDGHVPGALPVDWLDDLHAPVRRGFADAPALAALLGRLGVTPTTHVVLLGDAHNTYAASAFWLLRYYGHGPLSLVDGGRRAWEVEGRPLSTEVPEPAPADYPEPSPVSSVRASRDDILQRFVPGLPGTALLDCRTQIEYEGHGARGVDLPVERHRVPGHMPGARNLDSIDVLDEATHRFRPLPELRAMFADRGVEPDTEVALYCRLAERSSLLWFALHEVVGHGRARNYDGGWAEYGSLVDVPVER
ncbi:sulfurtransferase [Cellulomonas aerilata]|uniref:Sulfurtransferase n=1 Tax=Cellulomonas aerilata TaxID=515326 RepID=A0A512DCK9_9CELL|nr:rhodanese-like domain-containing protein [Cellulomonas aerilata]GEO34218.1 sulfurtransferase [Cellulomonas aerilata]